MGLPSWSTSPSQLFALVTGANSGLGYGICCRLIDEFLTSPSRSPSSHLVIIITTRTVMKTRFTIARLRHHLSYITEYSPISKEWQKKARAAGQEYKWQEMAARVHFLGIEVDLCDLKGVYDVADRLCNGTIGSPDAKTYEGLDRTDGVGRGLKDIKIPRLDVLILNAGIGGWVRQNWPLAIYSVLFDTIQATTWPQFKIASVGTLVKDKSSAKKQVGDGDASTQNLLNGEGHEESADTDKPILGEVFTANVFGHYVLSHELMPLLSNSAGREKGMKTGRIVWISSVEAVTDSFDPDDLQGLKSIIPYESSKRVTDLLALTASLPNVSRASESWFSPSNSKSTKASKNIVKPRVYVSHPGICATEIVPLSLFLQWAMMLAFYMARFLGSPWHTIQPYKGGCAPVWLALAEQETLDGMEGRTADGSASRTGKWGSSTDWWGEPRVKRTEVGGWGWSGVVGDEANNRKGRKRGAVDLTKEAREDFEIQGRKVWSEMEEMRRTWEDVLQVQKK